VNPLRIRLPGEAIDHNSPQNREYPSPHSFQAVKAVDVSTP